MEDLETSNFITSYFWLHDFLLLSALPLASSFNSGTVLKGHKAVRCDSCDMWIHNECLFMSETQYESVNNTKCTWICPKCEFFNFSDPFFGEQVKLETENRFVPLTKEKKDRSSPCGTNKSSFISGLKFISMNINSKRGKKWNCWFSLTFISHML